MSRRNFCLSLTLLLVLCSGVRAADEGRLTVDLFLDWEWVSLPQISPDGSQIAYTHRWTNKLNDRFETDIWVMNADGSRRRRDTADQA
jgi:dipeptidyl aminopeptidase/acylaminoacyl peptidase